MKRIFAWLKARVSTHSPRTPSTYWDERAQQYGRRAVYNLGHTEKDLASVDTRQKSILLPLLGNSLNGTERRALDLGCGVGRFSEDIARIARAKVSAVDFSSELLALAPTSTRVEYVLGNATSLPFPDEQFDLIWACLVFGALNARYLSSACLEIQRVAKHSALLFLVENTTSKPDAPTWAFRSVNHYKHLFPYFDLNLRTAYDDLGETISVMTGRRR
jgi:ubiquinone/menaquinone biosynthesis C-methylase UbiE